MANGVRGVWKGEIEDREVELGCIEFDVDWV